MAGWRKVKAVTNFLCDPVKSVTRYAACYLREGMSGYDAWLIKAREKDDAKK